MRVLDGLEVRNGRKVLTFSICLRSRCARLKMLEDHKVLDGVVLLNGLAILNDSNVLNGDNVLVVTCLEVCDLLLPNGLADPLVMEL